MGCAAVRQCLPALLVSAALSLLAMFGAGCDRHPRNLLLITVDTLRADRVGCYGYKDAETPSMDSLAREGVVFESARSPAPLTLPSHTSIMTGLYPPATGIRNNLYNRLGDRATTLAEIMRSHGWNTAAVLGSYILHSKFGLAQGFDHYDDRFITSDTARAADYPERKAQPVAQLGLQWLRDNAHRGRFFLWLHFYDPHAPYRPPGKYMARHPGNPYDGEVAYADSQVGRVIEELDRLGLAEDTAVVLAGDHGEGLGEHNESAHGLMVYDSTLRLPLLIRSPGWPAGARVAATVSTVDLAPTILSIMGISGNMKTSGRDLAPLAKAARKNGGRGTPKGWKSGPLYFESRYAFDEYGWAPLSGFVGPRYKYIRAPSPELYDIKSDPGELNNLAGSNPELVAKMSRQLSALVDTLAPQGGSLGENSEVSMEDLEQLRALGYVSSSPSEPVSDEEALKLPNPRDMLHVARAIQNAQIMILDGRYGEVLETLAKYEGRDPDNARLFMILGQAYEGLAHDEKAIDYFKRVIELKPKDPFALLSLAQLTLERGEPDVAADFIKLRKLYYPNDPINIKMEGRLYAALENWPEAARSYREFLEKEAQNAEGHLMLGIALEAMGDSDNAILSYRSAVHFFPGLAEARARLAEALLEKNKPSEAVPHIERWRELAPDDPAPYCALGRALLDLGDYAGAVENFNKTLQLDPYDLVALLNMARIAKVSPNLDGEEWWFRYRKAARKAGLGPEETAKARKLYEDAGGLH